MNQKILLSITRSVCQVLRAFPARHFAMRLQVLRCRIELHSTTVEECRMPVRTRECGAGFWHCGRWLRIPAVPGFCAQELVLLLRTTSGVGRDSLRTAQTSTRLPDS